MLSNIDRPFVPTDRRIPAAAAGSSAAAGPLEPNASPVHRTASTRAAMVPDKLGIMMPAKEAAHRNASIQIPQSSAQLGYEFETFLHDTKHVETFVADCEATDRFPTKAKIVQLALVPVDIKNLQAGAMAPSYKWIFNPEVHIPEQLTKLNIHHITDKVAKDHPPFSQQAPQVIRAISGRTLVFHNGSGYDGKLLNAEMSRLSPGLELDGLGTKLACTLLIAKALQPPHTSAKQSHIAERYGVADATRAMGHDAEKDALELVHVLPNMARSYGKYVGFYKQTIAEAEKIFPTLNGKLIYSPQTPIARFSIRRALSTLLSFGLSSERPAASSIPAPAPPALATAAPRPATMLAIPETVAPKPASSSTNPAARSRSQSVAAPVIDTQLVPSLTPSAQPIVPAAHTLPAAEAPASTLRTAGNEHAPNLERNVKRRLVAKRDTAAAVPAEHVPPTTEHLAPHLTIQTNPRVPSLQPEGAAATAIRTSAREHSSKPGLPPKIVNDRYVFNFGKFSGTGFADVPRGYLTRFLKREIMPEMHPEMRRRFENFINTGLENPGGVRPAPKPPATSSTPPMSAAGAAAVARFRDAAAAAGPSGSRPLAEDPGPSFLDFVKHSAQRTRRDDPGIPRANTKRKRTLRDSESYHGSQSSPSTGASSASTT